MHASEGAGSEGEGRAAAAQGRCARCTAGFIGQPAHEGLTPRPNWCGSDGATDAKPGGWAVGWYGQCGEAGCVCVCVCVWVCVCVRAWAR